MPVDAVDMQRQILDNIAVQTDSVIVARDLLETLGGFDERLHTAEDVELFLRCAAATRPVFLEEVFVDVYLGDDGTVRRYGRIARAACRREVFLRCGRHLVDRRLRHDRRRALAREALELARLHLADGARAEAARWLIRSVGGGLDADRLKVALECLLGTERYDRHSARAKGVARLWR